MPLSNENTAAAASPAAAVEHELTADELRAALSDLGHNRNGELVYTRCSLANRDLSCLTGLAQYGNLQQLVLDHNALTELTAVRHMPQLVYLSARHNRLTSSVSESLVGAASCLERLHLDDNCLSSLSGLEALPFITDLTCSHNSIAHVTARCLSAAQRLMRLHLDHNRIAAVDINAFDAARHLRVLQLEHNAIVDVSFLSSVSRQVERIALSDNHIEHLNRAVEHLTGLTVLDLSRNALSGLEELRTLRPLGALRCLRFDGNDALAHLPASFADAGGTHHHHSDADGGAGSAPPSGGRTEYHAEVVMSDEEGDGLGASGYGDERSHTVHPSRSPSDDGAGIGRPADEAHTPRPGGNKGGGGCAKDPSESMLTHAPSTARTASAAPAVAAAAVPTTASYVALAAPETHGFVRTVGAAARDAELSVRVDKTREILALPVAEQIFLWTLSLLPNLQQLNELPVSPSDVARANFLFSSSTA